MTKDNITNNYYGNIGVKIDHAESVSIQIDKDGNVKIENAETVIPSACNAIPPVSSDSPGLNLFPKELQTDDAKALLAKFQNAGLLDELYQPVDLSTYEQAVLAREISNKLWNKNSWKPFEILWNTKNLVSKYDRAMSMTKTNILFDVIRDVLKR